MSNPLWAKAIKMCADPQRAKHFLGLLAVTNAGPALRKVSAEQAQVLTALFSGSPALSNVLVANTGWLEALLEARDFATAYTRLRQFKQQQMLRIATRDLARVANAPAITREISDVADVCLDAVWQICRQQF